MYKNTNGGDNDEADDDDDGRGGWGWQWMQKTGTQKLDSWTSPDKNIRKYNYVIKTHTLDGDWWVAGVEVGSAISLLHFLSSLAVVCHVCATRA